MSWDDPTFGNVTYPGLLDIDYDGALDPFVNGGGRIPTSSV